MSSESQHEQMERELTARIVSVLREPVGFDASFDARVMAAVMRQPRPVPRPALSLERHDTVMTPAWVMRHRTLRISPLFGLAAAAGFAAVVSAATLALVSRDGAPRAAPAAVASAAAPDVKVVRFVLAAPGARQVALVGDFNLWDAAATPLVREEQPGLWSVSLELPPGRHAYAFVVDGESWLPDPAAPVAPGDDFGTPSSVVTVASST